MSDRGRGGRGGNRGGRGGGNASRGRGGGPGGANKDGDKPKREAILDLSKHVDKKIRVRFTGGREVVGILKGYDQLLNLVLDEVEETVRDPVTLEPAKPAQTRSLGLTVVRGTSLVVLNPVDGFGEIENPFANRE